MWKIIKLGRSVDVDFSNVAPDWYTREYSEKHWLLHPTITMENGFYLRKNEAPYDDIEEQRLILSDWDGWFHIDQIRTLQKAGYLVFFNEEKHQSQKTIFHGHIVKFKNND